MEDGISKADPGDIRPGDGIESCYRPIAERREKSRFKAFIKKLTLFLFPRHLVCHCCDREAVVNEFGICESCARSLKLAPNMGRIPYADSHAAGLLYEGLAAEALKSFKYGGALYKKELFVHYMEIPADWEFDYVIPVPLHKNRESKRGYNQSEVLAKEICRRYSLTLGEGFLIRINDTPKQALLSASDRIKNLKNAFSASDSCSGKAFLVVDDMRTTGATLTECAKALKASGAVRVYAITACCARYTAQLEE